MIPPRRRVSWDDINMLKAIIASWRSPDPNTQVGCYICTQDNRAVSDGYNSTPRNIDPCKIDWSREGEVTKYPYISHAERNAIHIAKRDLTMCKLYVTLHPCNSCAIDIIQSGVGCVFYLENKYINTSDVKAANWMFETANISIKQHQWGDRELVLSHLKQLLNLLTIP